MDRKDLARTTGGDSRSVKIDVLQNGVDLKYFLPGEGKRHKETIVVSGKMSYHANIAMVKHLVEVIMPQIWAQKPEAKLQIVGKDPPRLIRAMGEQPRVTVTGTVSDIRPYLQKATLAVVPITYGTGIQNKILEAMACATPVVVSSHAASSLQAVEGHEVLVADTASDFASAVLALLGDSGRRTSLGTAGRSYVERNHDWFRVAAQLVDIYDMAIQEGRWASRR
jgi:glycosyltransferase involved in cell wall biosynthesis